VVDYLCVAVIGLLVGGGELLNRYKDEPVKALFSLPAFFYVAVNVCAALIALRFIDVFQWVSDADPNKAFLLRVSTAGAGSMALFRSAIFNARIGNKDVGIGLSGLLDLFLDAADRAVDRSRATPRAGLIIRLMNDIDFAKANAGLPSFCMALMQNVSAAEQQSLANAVASLRESQIPDDIKSAILGLTLLNIVGEEVLKTAVDALRKKLSNTRAVDPLGPGPISPGVGAGGPASASPGVGAAEPAPTNGTQTPPGAILTPTTDTGAPEPPSPGP
jgi:hypothetical protein